MENITDDLSVGISDDLTKKIELFLINNISDDQDQAEIIKLINDAYSEGALAVLDKLDSQQQEDIAWGINSEVRKQTDVVAEQHDKFMEDFNKKLLDGQDNPVSE